MKKIVWIVAVTLLLVAGNAYAQSQGFALEKRIPSQSLFFMSCPDIGQARQAFQKTELAQLCREREIGQFIDALTSPYEQQIQGALKEVEKNVGVPLEDIFRIFYGELSLAVVDFDLRTRMPSVLLVIEFGPHRDKFEALLQNMGKAGIEAQETLQDGKKIYLLNGVPAPVPLCFAYEGNAFVFSNNPKLLAATLANPAGESLATSPDFVKAKAKLVDQKGTSAFFTYLNLRQIYKVVDPMMPPQAKGLMNSLGVFGIVSFAMTGNFCQEYIYDGFFIGVDGKPTGITEFLYGEPASLELLNKVPANATAFYAYHLNIAKIISEIEKIVKIVDPSGGLYRQYEQGYQQLEQILGFSITADVVASLGSTHWSFQYLPPSGGIYPVAIGVSKIKDYALFFKWTGQLATLMDLKMKKLTYRGSDIYYLSAPLGQLGQNPFDKMEEEKNPLKAIGYSFSGLACMVEGDYLYYGNAQDIKSFLRHRGQWKHFLGENETFQKLIAKMSTGSSFIAYNDFRSTATHLWNGLLIPLARLGEGMLRDAGIPFDSALLPQGKTVSRHLIPGISSYLSDGDGILVESYSATGSILYVIPVVGITAAIAIPGLMRARISGNEASTIGSLYSLGCAQTQFQMSCEVDQDKDGIGEYGYLQELCGQTTLRGKSEDYHSMPYSGGFDFDKDGVARKNGYYFYCYLPGKNKAIGERGGNMPALNPEKDANAIDFQECHYIIYAWPIKTGKTGRRAFVLTESGKIYTNNKHFYSRWNRPRVEDAFSAIDSENAQNLQGRIADWEYGHNDTFWQTTN